MLVRDVVLVFLRKIINIDHVAFIVQGNFLKVRELNAGF